MSLCDRDQLLPEVREAVPKNEKIQWTGRPEWKSFAYQSFGLKYLIAYFVISGLYVAASMDQSFVLRIFLTNFINLVNEFFKKNRGGQEVNVFNINFEVFIMH